jgi:hypothetical protein
MSSYEAIERLDLLILAASTTEELRRLRIQRRRIWRAIRSAKRRARGRA